MSKFCSPVEYVFVMDTDYAKPASISGVNHAHERVRDILGLPAEFVLHSSEIQRSGSSTLSRKNGRVNPSGTPQAERYLVIPTWLSNQAYSKAVSLSWS